MSDRLAGADSPRFFRRTSQLCWDFERGYVDLPVWRSTFQLMDRHELAEAKGPWFFSFTVSLYIFLYIYILDTINSLASGAIFL